MEVLEAEQRVDVQARDRLGRLGGDRLDVHAALGREHHQRRLGAAVEDHRRVVLGGDLRRPLDPYLVDGQAANVHAEDRLSVRCRLIFVVGDLDAAEFAASTDLYLRFDCARVTDLLSCRHRFLHGARGLAGGDWDSVPCEQLLALIFEQVHTSQSIGFRR